MKFTEFFKYSQYRYIYIAFILPYIPLPTATDRAKNYFYNQKEKK